MKTLFLSVVLLLAWGSFAVVAEEQDWSEPTAEQLAYQQKAYELWDAMEHKKGTIELANNVAKLNVPDDFYFLDAKDAHVVLTEFWGNPPDESTLGMLFAEGSTPFDGESWGVTIEYTQEGYVSDEDADEIDYTELLSQMQQDTRDYNSQRVSAGYESIELVGWAAEPFYDPASHKMHWAKEIRFGDSPEHTLNYNIRVLGRKGVLVLNFIAGINQLETINSKLDRVLAMADFNTGSSYADFNPDIDTVAAYGIGALVAGKVIAKTGLLVGLLLFVKKFGIIIVIAIGGLLKKIFNKKNNAV